jgi:hypothetical protein
LARSDISRSSVSTPLRSLALTLVFLGVCAGFAQAQESSSEKTGAVAAEIDRLQKSLKDKPIANSDLGDLTTAIGGLLNDSRTALAGGHLYLCLENLGRAENLLAGARYVDEHAAAVKDNLPAFESIWNKTSAELAAFEKNPGQQSRDSRQAAVRALADAARGQIHPLLEGGRGFATATQPRDGLFYTGQAQGEAAFAAFLDKLNLSAGPRPFPFRSLEPELQALQEKTNAAFQPPRSIDMHPRFIALNSALKFARELDASGAYAGALYQYLEAVRHFGMLDAAAPAPEAAKQTELRGAVEKLGGSLGSQRDDSLAKLFLERAGSQINKPEGAQPSADEWRSAQVILEQVMPAYYGTLKPAAPSQRHPERTATLTLVRWPYT